MTFYFLTHAHTSPANYKLSTSFVLSVVEKLTWTNGFCYLTDVVIYSKTTKMEESLGGGASVLDVKPVLPIMLIYVISTIREEVLQ